MHAPPPLRWGGGTTAKALPVGAPRAAGPPAPAQGAARTLQAKPAAGRHAPDHGTALQVGSTVPQKQGQSQSMPKGVRSQRESAPRVDLAGARIPFSASGAALTSKASQLGDSVSHRPQAPDARAPAAWSEPVVLSSGNHFPAYGERRLGAGAQQIAGVIQRMESTLTTADNAAKLTAIDTTIKRKPKMTEKWKKEYFEPAVKKGRERYERIEKMIEKDVSNLKDLTFETDCNNFINDKIGLYSFRFKQKEKYSGNGKLTIDNMQKGNGNGWYPSDVLFKFYEYWHARQEVKKKIPIRQVKNHNVVNSESANTLVPIFEDLTAEKYEKKGQTYKVAKKSDILTLTIDDGDYFFAALGIPNGSPAVNLLLDHGKKLDISGIEKIEITNVSATLNMSVFYTLRQSE